MADEGTTKIFVFLVCVWVLIILLSGFLDIEVTGSDIHPQDRSFSLEPLLQIMMFQVNDTGLWFISLVIDMLFILTVFVAVSMIRG